MNATSTVEDLVRRIVVSLDPSTETKPLLDFAADLAAKLEIPLVGVFVEDTTIADFAELPFAREICLSGATVRDLSRRRMQSYSRTEAARARRALEVAGSTHRVQYSFELRRGRLEVELASVAQEWDLIAISPGAGAVVRPRGHDVFGRLGASAAMGFLAFARKSAAEGEVLAVYTGSPESRRGVILAARIATRRRAALTVVLTRALAESGAEQDIHGLTAGAGVIEILQREDRLPGFLQARSSRLQMIVIPADLPAEAQNMTRALNVPSLVIRKSQGPMKTA